MAILEKEVLVTCRPSTISHYNSFEYNCKMNDLIMVKVEHLPNGSHALITKICDKCGNNVENQKYKTILEHRDEFGIDRCKNCKKASINRKKVVRVVKYENSLECVAKDKNMEHLLDEFDVEKNLKTIREISASSHYKLWWKCPKCKSGYDANPHNRISGRSNCPYCRGLKVNETNSLNFTHPDLVKEWHLIKNGDKTVFNITRGHSVKCWWICFKCGGEYDMSPKDRTCRDSSCPTCSESKGEKRVDSYLKTNNIKYKSQYSFEDCKMLAKLRFDFAVLDESNNPLYLIEYDGIQHFQPSFGDESFIRTKKSDFIKNNYCISKNLKLIRIPYWDYESIEKILNKSIS